MAGVIQRNKTLIFLFVILVIAAFFRLWQLDQIPPWLYPDVAMNGNDALETLRTGNFKVFYSENNGREGLMMWLIALSFLTFGISVWSIKFVAAVIGIITVFGLYLLTVEIFRNTKYNIQNTKYIALLASFFLAISFWHVNFSRIGFRAILLPFVLVFSFYFLFKGLRTQKIWSFILAGLFFGLGFYTYASFRMAVLILPFVIIPYWLDSRKQNLQKKFLLSILYFLLTTFIIALPIGIYFLQSPQDFASRAAPVSVLTAENPLKELGKSFILHLAMFNVYGDANWRHNYATSPQLFWPIGTLFLIGVIVGFREVFRKLNYRNKNLASGKNLDSREARNKNLASGKNLDSREAQIKNYQTLSTYYFLLSSLFLMLLPGILTHEGIPHALRTVGVIPAVFIFSGLGAWKVYEFLQQNIKNKKLFLSGRNKVLVKGKVFIFAYFFFLLALAASEYNKYFNLWANNDKLKEAFTENYADIGYFLNSLPQGIKKYVIVNTSSSPLYGISIAAQTPMFIESTKFKKPRATYLKFEQLDQIDIYQRKSIVLPLYEDGVFDELSQKFPWGKIRTEKDLKYFDLSY